MYGEEEDLRHCHQVGVRPLGQQRLTPAAVLVVIHRVSEVSGQEQARRVAQHLQLLAGVQGEEEAKGLFLVPRLLLPRRHFIKSRRGVEDVSRERAEEATGAAHSLRGNALSFVMFVRHMKSAVTEREEVLVCTCAGGGMYGVGEEEEGRTNERS